MIGDLQLSFGSLDRKRVRIKAVRLALTLTGVEGLGDGVILYLAQEGRGFGLAPHNRRHRTTQATRSRCRLFNLKMLAAEKSQGQLTKRAFHQQEHCGKGHAVFA